MVGCKTCWTTGGSSSLPGAGALPPRSPSGFNKPAPEWSVSLLVVSQHDSRFPRISRTGSLGNFTLESMADWFLLVDERITPQARLKGFSDGFWGGIKNRIPQHFLLPLSVRCPPLFLLRCFKLLWLRSGAHHSWNAGRGLVCHSVVRCIHSLSASLSTLISLLHFEQSSAGGSPRGWERPGTLHKRSAELYPAVRTKTTVEPKHESSRSEPEQSSFLLVRRR